MKLNIKNFRVNLDINKIKTQTKNLLLNVLHGTQMVLSPSYRNRYLYDQYLLEQKAIQDSSEIKMNDELLSTIKDATAVLNTLVALEHTEDVDQILHNNRSMVNTYLGDWFTKYERGNYKKVVFHWNKTSANITRYTATFTLNTGEQIAFTWHLHPTSIDYVAYVVKSDVNTDVLAIPTHHSFADIELVAKVKEMFRSYTQVGGVYLPEEQFVK